ncbi:Constitutive lysine decarboxylase [Bienertia sinuspersici]
MGEPHSLSSSSHLPQFPDNSPHFSLSSDQFQHCSHALHSLKLKLDTPHLIQREFDSLQDYEMGNHYIWRDQLYHCIFF